MAITDHEEGVVQADRASPPHRTMALLRFLVSGMRTALCAQAPMRKTNPPSRTNEAPSEV